MNTLPVLLSVQSDAAHLVISLQLLVSFVHDRQIEEVSFLQTLIVFPETNCTFN